MWTVIRFLPRRTTVLPSARPAWVRRMCAGMPAPEGSSEEGSSTLELCLVLPIFVLILAAATDISLMCQKYLVVAEAAAAGTRYGSSGGNSSSLPGMENAAQTSAGGINGFTATATAFCTCSPGGAWVSCSSSCTSQLSPVQYVQVSTKAPLSFPFKALGFSGTMQLVGSSTMRVSGATQ